MLVKMEEDKLFVASKQNCDDFTEKIRSNPLRLKAKVTRNHISGYFCF